MADDQTSSKLHLKESLGQPEGIPTARPILQHHAPLPSPGHTGGEFMLTTAERGSVMLDIIVMAVFLVSCDVLAGTLFSISLIPEDLQFDFGDPRVRQAWLVPSLTARAACVLLGIGAILSYRRQSLRSVGIAPDGLPTNVLIGIGAVAATYLLMFAWQLLIWVAWPGMWEQMMENAELLMALVPRLSPLGYAAIALSVGVYEELLFRGFLMPRLRRATGSWTAAVVLSTAVFTSLHSMDQTPAALFPITILSISFSLTTIWRRSIIPAIVGHFLFNFFQFLGLFYYMGET